MEYPALLTSSTQLLVEGVNPKRVFSVFCRSWNLPDIEIHDFGSNQNLRRYLETFTRTRGFAKVTSLGIIRDGEESAESAFQSVRGALRSARLQAPTTPGVSSSGIPSISVLILPDGNSQGNLESLLWRSVEDTSEARCADDFLSCLELHAITVSRKDKARVQAYLASKRKPHGSVGVAAERGHWDPEHQSFSELRRFLTNLQDATASRNSR